MLFQPSLGVSQSAQGPSRRGLSRPVDSRKKGAFFVVTPPVKQPPSRCFTKAARPPTRTFFVFQTRFVREYAVRGAYSWLQPTGYSFSFSMCPYPWPTPVVISSVDRLVLLHAIAETATGGAPLWFCGKRTATASMHSVCTAL